MSERPDLNINMDEQTFRSYYYLKEELADFCRKNGCRDTTATNVPTLLP